MTDVVEQAQARKHAMPGDPALTNSNVILRDMPQSIFVQSDDLEWVEVPESQGMMHIKMLHLDQVNNGATFLMRFQPGVQLTVHRHVGEAELFVLKGSFTYWGRTLRAGGYGYEADGTIHEPSVIEEELIMYIRTGPVREFEEDGTMKPGLDGTYEFYRDAVLSAGVPTDYLKIQD